MPASNWEQIEGRLEAVALALREGQPAPEEPAGLIDDVVVEASAWTRSHNHDASIALLERALSSFPDDPKLRRQTALAYGGKAEWSVNLADRLGVVPRPERLPLLLAPLERAVQLDPTVPDPHWDLAVIKARFTRDFKAADKHFDDAKALDYRHRRMSDLTALIRDGLAGTAPLEVDDSGAAQLKHLVWELVLWPDGPPGAAELAARPTAPFETYCHLAAQLVRAGTLDLAGFAQARHAAARLEGDAAEIAADLLRVTAAEFGDQALLAEATEAHLRIVARMSFALRGRITEGPGNPEDPEDPQFSQWLMRARKAALRGLKIVDAAAFPVNPDVHADLLLAFGQTYTHPRAYNLREAMQSYLRALDLKEAAANAADISRLRQLLRRMIDHEVRQVQLAPVLGGIGVALADLEVGYVAAQRCGDTPLTVRVGIQLAVAYSDVRQPANGETVLREVLALDGLEEGQRLQARLQLASALSESGRAEAALEIQEDLKTDPILGKLPATWLNLGNSRRVSGGIEAAHEAFAKALSLVGREGRDQALSGQILGLLGQTEFLLGSPNKAVACFRQGEKAFGDMQSLDALRFHTLAGEQFFNAGKHLQSRRHLGRARRLLAWHLSEGASLAQWESMLQSWSAMDAYDVESLLSRKGNEARHDALVRAESAKGRLLAWLRKGLDPGAAAEALQDERQRESVTNVLAWVNAAPGRLVLALFAADRGLAVFALGKGEKLDASWIDDFGYEGFRSDCFEPWEDAVARGMSGEPGLWEFANGLTDHLLARVGEWLWRAVPALAKGGEELVIVPHRLFRSLPLAHCRLPGGRSLSELFRRITIAPSLFDLAEALQAPRLLGYRPPITALVDPDATLPFARLEGYCAAGNESTLAHEAATVEALRRAFGEPGIVLVSAHGDFREDNPWLSMIQASDAPFELQHLLGGAVTIRAHIVVLGVCEAGKTRRSASDEPLGFASVLVQAGVGAVVAPLWRVDDFASLFFATRLFDHLREQVTAARALLLTAEWMRRLSRQEALAYFDGLSQRLQYRQHPAIDAALQQVLARARRNRDWLAGLRPEDKPFRSPLDWAAFQVVGSPL